MKHILLSYALFFTTISLYTMDEPVHGVPTKPIHTSYSQKISIAFHEKYKTTFPNTAISLYLAQNQWVSRREYETKKQLPYRIRQEIVQYRIDRGLLVINSQGKVVQDISYCRQFLDQQNI